MSDEKVPEGIRERLRRIIFEADTPAGKYFDVLLIVCIGLSVGVVMLDSIEAVGDLYGDAFYLAEWGFTILFTIEYITRMYCVERPIRYVRSFFGIVDLLAILPTYLSLLFPGTHYLAVIRIVRVLRVFRILKFVKYVREAEVLLIALRSSRRKIAVFLLSIAALVVILGSLMYVIESAESGFTSIPMSVYWAIVTLTTVGYGDVSPQTPLGQLLAAVVMIAGYSIIAVPTGIFTAEMFAAVRRPVTTRICAYCTTEGHLYDAKFCKDCGEPME